MQIVVENNPLKMLGQCFMHVVPRKGNEALVVGAKHTVSHPAYGDMGVVEVAEVFSVPLHNLRPVCSLLTNGNLHLADALRAAHHAPTEMMQCVTLRFVRRHDAAFEKLLRTELRRAGLNIFSQLALQLPTP